MTINGRKLGICYAVATAITLVAVFAKGVFRAEDAKALYLGLSDAFFTGGGLILVSGGLYWTNGQGVGDGLSYSVSRFFGRRGVNYESDRREGYAQYKERKHSKKAHVAEFLISGLTFVAIAFVFMVLNYYG